MKRRNIGENNSWRKLIENGSETKRQRVNNQNKTAAASLKRRGGVAKKRKSKKRRNGASNGGISNEAKNIGVMA
jgi:hypothetical protein